MSIDNYDIIIDINSIRFLKSKGWKIYYLKEKELKSSKKSIVLILGHSNKGKTYILASVTANPGAFIEIFIQSKIGEENITKIKWY